MLPAFAYHCGAEHGLHRVMAWPARRQARHAIQRLPCHCCDKHRNGPHTACSRTQGLHTIPFKRACLLPAPAARFPVRKFGHVPAMAPSLRHHHATVLRQHSPQTITGSPWGLSAACSQVSCSHSGRSFSSWGTYTTPPTLPRVNLPMTRRCPCRLTSQQPKSCQASLPPAQSFPKHLSTPEGPLHVLSLTPVDPGRLPVHPCGPPPAGSSRLADSA